MDLTESRMIKNNSNEKLELFFNILLLVKSILADVGSLEIGHQATVWSVQNTELASCFYTLCFVAQANTLVILERLYFQP